MDHETTPISQLGPSALGFVVNSWVRSWWKQSANVDHRIYYSTFPDVARKVCARGDVLIAHFEGNPDVFMGWIAFDREHPNQLHYVYIKESYRKQGVARRLVRDHLSGDVEMSLRPTSRWKRDKARAYGFTYNPYQLMLIGDDNGSEKTTAA